MSAPAPFAAPPPSASTAASGAAASTAASGAAASTAASGAAASTAASGAQSAAHSERLLYSMLAFNESFVARREYKQWERVAKTGRRVVVVTCMDTRLTFLLPEALNLHKSDVKYIKNAGAAITHPFGDIMRSVMVAIFELGADEVFVVGHSDCGMTHIDSSATLVKMVEHGIARHTLVTMQYAGINVQSWLSGFESVEDSVVNSVDIIRNHPLTPARIPVHGLVIHPETGLLDLVVDGYKELPVLTGGLPHAHNEWLAAIPPLPLPLPPPPPPPPSAAAAEGEAGGGAGGDAVRLQQHEQQAVIASAVERLAERARSPRSAPAPASATSADAAMKEEKEVIAGVVAGAGAGGGASPQGRSLAALGILVRDPRASAGLGRAGADAPAHAPAGGAAAAVAAAAAAAAAKAALAAQAAAGGGVGVGVGVVGGGGNPGAVIDLPASHTMSVGRRPRPAKPLSSFFTLGIN